MWLFSSGPLDRSADFDDIPMTPHVAEAVGDLPIRGHRTFGGRLLADAPEVAAGIIATHRTGDYRDFDAIRAWAADDRGRARLRPERAAPARALTGGPSGPPGGGLPYFAYSIERVSRMTVTLIWPG